MNVVSRIRATFAKCAPLKSAYDAIFSWRNAALYHISPLLFAKLRYRWAWGKWPDLDDPRSFDEKLLWLMLYWRHPLKTFCGDKYTMRAYVEQEGLEHILPQLFAEYERADEIDFKTLPDRFVLKCSHGCKCNLLVKRKADLDIQKVRRDLDAWIKTDYSTHLGELHYATMHKRIICEEFLEEPGQELPHDYKVLCFDGKAYCTMACEQRDLNGKPKLDFYDREWKSRLPYAIASMKADQWIPKPLGYEKIIEAAERLSKPFPFVRVDFYSINARIVLGEMTFTPGACVSQDYLTELAQRDLGALIRLPKECLQ